MKDLSGHPKRWRYLGNMQFREVGGQQLLIFKHDPSGHLEMLTEEPIEIFQRVELVPGDGIEPSRPVTDPGF